MPKKDTMPTSAQAAAVRTMVNEGTALEDIEKRFPELKSGVDVVKKELAKPKSRGSGSVQSKPLSRPSL